MTLQQWAEYGWLRSHSSSMQEISDLLAIADRDIADAGSGGISTDWQFGIAYNAKNGSYSRGAAKLAEKIK